jgi:ubiquitin-protein ligase/uncharacterized protein YegL
MLLSLILGDATTRGGLDFVACVDKSGSMSGEPFDLVKQALSFMVENLSANDQFSIVTFGSESSVDLQLCAMTPDGKKNAQRIIAGLRISGSTNLSAGLFSSIAQIRTSLLKDRATSILLLTDGHATDGITAAPALAKEALARLRALPNTVSISTFGLSAGHSAAFLRQISDPTGGMYHFIENAASIKGHFAQFLGGLLSTVAKDMVLTLDLPAGVTLVKCLSNLTEQPGAGSRRRFSLGDIYSEERRNVVFQLRVPFVDSPGPQTLAEFSLHYLHTISSGYRTCSSVCTIERIPKLLAGAVVQEDDETRTRNMAVDEQRNRLVCATALEQAANGVTPKETLQRALSALQQSVSHTSPFTQALEKDLREALAAVNGNRFDHTASKYLYSLSRSHFNQRSSGITASGAAAYLTTQQASMQALATGSRFDALRPPQPTAVAPSAAAAARVPVAVPVAAVAARVPVAAAPLAPVPAVGKNGAVKVGGVTLVPARTRVVDLSANRTADEARKERQGKVELTRSHISKAVRRLMLDWAELQHTPLAHVAAAPLEADVFEWHANMTAPLTSAYHGIVFHLVLIFPHTYPVDPPKIFFCSYISHQHVFGSWVCLDMLEEAAFGSAAEVGKPYTGWSSGYSVQSIMLQLQAFLFDEADCGKEPVERARTSARLFACTTGGCAHTHAVPAPELPRSLPAPVVAPPLTPPTSATAAATPSASTGASPAVSSPAATPRKVALPPMQSKPVPACPSVVSRLTATPPPAPAPAATSAAAKQAPAAAPAWGRAPVAAAGAPTAAALPLPAVAPAVSAWKVPSAVSKIKQGLAPASAPAPTIQQRAAAQAPAAGSPATVAASPAAAAPKRMTLLELALAQMAEPAPAPKPVASAAAPSQRPAAGKRVAPSRPSRTASAAAASSAPAKAMPPATPPTQPPVASPSPVVAPAPLPAAPAWQEDKGVTVRLLFQQGTAVVPQQAFVFGSMQAKPEPAAAPASAPAPAAPSPAAVVPTPKAVASAPAPAAVVPAPLQKPAVTSAPTVDLSLAGALQQQVKAKGAAVAGLDASFFSFLVDELILGVLSHIPPRQLARVSLVCKEFGRLARDGALWRTLIARLLPGVVFQSRSPEGWMHALAGERSRSMAQRICFHSKRSFTEVVLGVPITLEYNSSSGKLDRIHSTLDLLSWEAYHEDGIRRGVWKEKFTDFLPVWISYVGPLGAILSLLLTSVSS